LEELESVPGPLRMSGGGDDEMTVVEFESFESRLVFDVSTDADVPMPMSPSGNLAYSPLPGERRAPRTPPAPGKADASTGDTAKGPGQVKFNPGDELDLDPLFDEDD